MEKIDQYTHFFGDQISDAQKEYEAMADAPMSQLLHNEDMCIGYLDHINVNNGHVVIKFKRGTSPRLKVQKVFVLFAKGALETLKECKWSCTFREFSANKSLHTSSSDIIPMYYSHTAGDADYEYVECAGLSIKMYDLISGALSKGKSLTALVYNPFPPLDYLYNLTNYLKGHSDNQELLIQPQIEYEDWKPEELAFDSQHPSFISDRILSSLESDSCCILQGPPGTGKSYTIASIIAYYLAKDKTVCVTTMANKGLIELIAQPPLMSHVSQGKVHKTNLSIDEKKQVEGVLPAEKDLVIQQGHLLCATNYALSQLYSKDRGAEQGMPNFDLVVIEEASQAFLTTIVAFKELADKCLIVGDPMQLPPIVTHMSNPMYKTWDISYQIEGMKTFALGTNTKAFRITTTFRLTPKSAELTAMFYGNRFTSVKKELLDFSQAKESLFPNEGGALYCCTNDCRNGIYSISANNVISQVVEQMAKYYPDRTLAIISPFNDTVKELQKRFSTADINLDIVVETIDRIQGMTVDYAILYLAGRNPGFALEEKRFNVATSRSLSTTLIVSDIPLENLHSASNRVLSYVAHCKHINSEGTIQQKKEQTKASLVPQESFVTNSSSSNENVDIPVTVPKVGVKVVGSIDLSQFERKRKEIKADKQNIYIIDTNVFVDCPDVIDRIDSKYRIVLSAKVVDELDTMKIKLDEEGKRNAQKALRNINIAIDKRGITMECADMSLLPEDFKKSPDNMILSVAMKFKGENPIVLTSDSGLQIKSKGMGISTISLKDFLRK